MDLVAYTELYDGEDFRGALERLKLQPIGRIFATIDGRRMSACEPILEELYSGEFDVYLDWFHRKVVACFLDARVVFDGEDAVRAAATALNAAADKAEQVFAGRW
ncbi:hypothetical protein [Phytoactinopolyspora mesophila]|uniref:Uncharacterized protein n=1 Tax=Phytoactinopolyspora mesophila TaxID=2650750 RepID=A0A7K3M134_9ACTN|nr:hypothetical protein [Phytoactinopolyspora mesophila]NDL56984.1 hypothetical protein [Phytoactinopolyspora mesophila]